MASRASVAREIQEQIRTGLLRSGNRLPSERSLALKMGVSRATIQAAIRDIEAQGLVQCRPNCRPRVVNGRSIVSADTGQRAGQIAIWILPNMQDLGGTLILQGIRAAFGNHSYRILIGCPPSRERAVVEAAAALRANGVTVEPFDPPDIDEAMRLYFGLCGADGGAGFRELLGSSQVDWRVRRMLRWLVGRHCSMARSTRAQMAWPATM